MTEQEAIECLKEINKKLEQKNNRYDQESAHIEADEILCNFLKDLGYDTLLECYWDIPKWYA